VGRGGGGGVSFHHTTFQVDDGRATLIYWTLLQLSGLKKTLFLSVMRGGRGEMVVR